MGMVNGDDLMAVTAIKDLEGHKEELPASWDRIDSVLLAYVSFSYH